MACSSCSTTCSGGCSSACSNNCSTTCTNACTAACTYGCSTSCTSTCSAACSSGCSGVCSIGCTGTCSSSCSGTCSSGCSDGCSTTCSNNCATVCSNTCSGTSVTDLGTLHIFNSVPSSIDAGEEFFFAGVWNYADHTAISIDAQDYTQHDGEGFNRAITITNPGTHYVRVEARNTPSSSDYGTDYGTKVFTIEVLEVIGDYDTEIQTLLDESGIDQSNATTLLAARTQAILYLIGFTLSSNAAEKGIDGLPGDLTEKGIRQFMEWKKLDYLIDSNTNDKYDVTVQNP